MQMDVCRKHLIDLLGSLQVLEQELLSLEINLTLLEADASASFPASGHSQQSLGKAASL